MTADGRDPVQVTRTGGFAPLVSADGKHLYYQKTQGYSDIWTTPVGGGEETKVIDLVGRRQFAVSPDGIYYVRTAAEGQRLQFFDFGSRTPRDLAPSTVGTGLGLTVSPDGRYVVYTQPDQYGSDLMLVERFQ